MSGFAGKDNVFKRCRKWSENEKTRLLSIAQTVPKSKRGRWELIAELFNGGMEENSKRSPRALKEQFLISVEDAKISILWTKELDETLVKIAVEEQCRWRVVAKHLKLYGVHPSECFCRNRHIELKQKDKMQELPINSDAQENKAQKPFINKAKKEEKLRIIDADVLDLYDITL